MLEVLEASSVSEHHDITQDPVILHAQNALVHPSFLAGEQLRRASIPGATSIHARPIFPAGKFT